MLPNVHLWCGINIQEPGHGLHQAIRKRRNLVSQFQGSLGRTALEGRACHTPTVRRSQSQITAVLGSFFYK